MSRTGQLAVLRELPRVQLGGQRGVWHGCRTEVNRYVLREL
jgi:hypothetical protein